ncbi:MAG: D-aminoacyl-tRNA deacylase [Candidatus Thermoplasmatota archaeon]|nr:D-aminoacyl-tRNA deacylase [Candidatus Thermoplasmatota archaeon]
MTSQQVSILAVNVGDIASYNQAKYLLDKFQWIDLGSIEEKTAYQLNDVRMWMFDGGILFEDDIDKRWQQQTGEIVREVIFPSRHAAESGKPSLTLHPIGVPHLDINAVPKFGGKSGFAPPPSTRLASWWKMLQNYVDGTELANQFELTLEVTHHGPWLEVPALFIEIGSTKETWPHEGAAELLARIISDGMGISSSNGAGLWNSDDNAGELVLVTLGGGHYAPRANKLDSMDGFWLGHMLATYALPFEKSEDEHQQPGGTWKQSIDSALDATKKAFPNGQLICSMDKKAFRGWQRQAIRDHLTEVNIPLLTTKQIIEILDKQSQAS